MRRPSSADEAAASGPDLEVREEVLVQKAAQARDEQSGSPI